MADCHRFGEGKSAQGIGVVNMVFDKQAAKHEDVDQLHRVPAIAVHQGVHARSNSGDSLGEAGVQGAKL